MWIICFIKLCNIWLIRKTIISVAIYSAAMNSGHGKGCKAQPHKAY